MVFLRLATMAFLYHRTVRKTGWYITAIHLSNTVAVQPARCLRKNLPGMTMARPTSAFLFLKVHRSLYLPAKMARCKHLSWARPINWLIAIAHNVWLAIRAVI